MESPDKVVADDISTHFWMMRPCEVYKDEYKDCRSFKARFNQYFIFGEYSDCSQWKSDFNNCLKYNSSQDEVAKKELITSEYARKKERLQAHYDNDIWKKRKEPPADWNKPLPDWVLEQYKNSYLDFKTREAKGEKVNDIFPKSSLCNIM